jgi:hypothetical protein
MASKFVLLPAFPALIVFVFSFIVYLFTMDPGLGFIDSGELATVCARLGIAHPTGYPLFTLIGWLFSNLPIPVSVILKLNIMAALFTAAASGVVVLLTHEIAANWWSPKPKAISQQKGRKQGQIEPAAQRPGANDFAASLFAGFLTAFSLTWWQQATSLEVYSLHILLITLALYFFLRMLRLEDLAVGKNGYLFAITLGLAFTNHLTTILLAPAMLYAFFARYRGAGLSRIAKLALPFAAMLLIYLYLPIRAGMDPILNWGDPSDMKQFLKHVTGGQYKIWMFTGESAGQNWSMFWSGLGDQFSWPLALLSLAGIPALLEYGRKQRVNMLVFFLLLVFGCVFYAINYDINDIQSYFVLAYLSIALMIAVGVEWLVRTFMPASAQESRYASVVIGLLFGLTIGSNYEQADESGNHLVEDYTRNMLLNLPKNAIIFSTQWDFWVSGALYYQLVEGLRADVVVVDKHLMRDRPWYFDHLRQRAPEVMKRVEPEANEFLKHLRAFDRDEPFDQQAIGPAYQRFVKALIEKNQDRPQLLTTEMVEEQDDLLQAAGRQPVGAGVALSLLEAPLPTSLPKLSHRSVDYDKRGYYPDNLRRLHAAPLVLTAARYAEQGNRDMAQQYFDLAMRLKPEPRDSYDDLPEKERDFALRVDQSFIQFEQLRSRLLSPTTN